MSACATQVFQPFPPSAWTCLVEKAAANGITISDPQGSSSRDGYTFAWDYNSDGDGSFSITCTDSPWYAPCSTINGNVHALVEGCM